MTTIPYLDVDNLEAFELIVALKAVNIQYVPWDTQLNSIRNIFGSLFVVEYEEMTFICFLCSALIDESQLSKRLYDLMSMQFEQQNKHLNPEESNDSKPIDDFSQFAFNVNLISLIKFSKDDWINKDMNDSKVISDNYDDDDVLMTLKLRSNKVVPLIFSRPKLNDKSPPLRNLWGILQKQLHLKRSEYQPNTYIVEAINATDDSTLSPQTEKSRKLFQQLNLHDLDKKTREHFFAKMLRSPQTAVLDELSKVTNLFRDTMNKTENLKHLTNDDINSASEDLHFQIDWSQVNRYVEGDSLMGTHNVSSTSLLDDDEFYNNNNIDTLRVMACERGLSTTVRSKVWDIFTGFTSLDMTDVKRQECIDRALREYKIIRSQWECMLPVQINNNTSFRERQSQIDKDLHRIPPKFLEFPGRSKDQWSTFYRNILISFSLYNNDVGYSQAITDILIVLSYVYCGSGNIDNRDQGDDQMLLQEAHVFAVLCSLMDSFFSDNFRDQQDQSGLLRRLNLLSKIVKFADVKLAQYLDENNSLSMFFCFRWIVVWFAREFPVEDLVRLWDAILSQWPCNYNFDLLICFAMLESKREELMKDERDFDGVLQFANSMSSLTTDEGDSGNRDFSKVNKIIHTAISIHKQLLQSPDIPNNLKNALQMAQ
ncbi:hypothetical protein GJ496_010237 [Pomphorhynchus laevis]|nr:hypothetical protein GJ496_010237 [Pomphorhynchus laevis]